MGNKQAMTILGLDIKRNDELVREKIKELKTELKKFTTSRIGTLHRICTELVNLRRSLPGNRGKRYTIRSLEWEKDLNLTQQELRAIQSYVFLSDYSKVCINKGLIRDSTVCHFLVMSSLLRERKYQDKLVKMVIENKVRMSYINELTKDELRLFLLGKLKRKNDNPLLINSVKTIRSLTSRLRAQKELLAKDSIYRKHLILSVNNLKKYLDGLK